MKNIFYGLLLVSFLVYACTETTSEDTLEPIVLNDTEENPFDSIDYTIDIPDNITVDSNSFLGLYTYIFSTSCAIPGCHDGSFEPDFRTIQSAYNTLVFHPVYKNYNLQDDGRNPLTNRVTPFDPEQSMLYKRISEHFLPNFERMPSSGIALTNGQVNLIKNWIEEGAKDINGNIATQSSLQPSCFGLLAYLPEQSNERVDRIGNRTENYALSPFIIPPNTNLELWFLVFDLNSSNEYLFGNALTYNKVQFSTDPFDFSNAVELNLTVPLVPKLEPIIFSSLDAEAPLPYYQNVTFNPSDYGFEVGETVYMSVIVQDADHDDPTWAPAESASIFFKRYFAFYIQ